MKKILFALAYYIAELPITLAQTAFAGVIGTVIGALLSPFGGQDPGTYCLYGATVALGLGFAAASWLAIARARDFDLS